MLTWEAPTLQRPLEEPPQPSLLRWQRHLHAAGHISPPRPILFKHNGTAGIEIMTRSHSSRLRTACPLSRGFLQTQGH